MLLLLLHPKLSVQYVKDCEDLLGQLNDLLDGQYYEKQQPTCMHADREKPVAVVDRAEFTMVSATTRE